MRNEFIGAAVLVTVAALALAGCKPEAQPPTADQVQAKQIKDANADAQVALINARSALAVAKIDAETNKIKAKAQTEINALIQDSVRDKALLKNWNLGTDGVTWASSASARVVANYDFTPISTAVSSTATK